MKASITISDTIGILAIILITLFLVTQILPTVFSTIINQFSTYSAENVARQLSNLITISGSATYKAEINYSAKAQVPSGPGSTSEVLYKILIDSKTIKVVPKFEVNYAENLAAPNTLLSICLLGNIPM